MSLATLSIDLEARIANLQEGMDKAGRLLQKQAADMEARWARVEASVRGVALALGGIATVRGLGALFLDTVRAVDGFNDLADATGASIENISALENAARANGGTLEDVSGILIKFNSALKEAGGNNDATRVFKALNLDVAELKRLDPAQALQRTAAALAEYADDGNKARIIQELFGKSIREAAPFLKDLAEAGQLNATVTKEQAAEAERFNKNLAALRTSAEDFARTVSASIVPALNEFFVRSNQARESFGGFAGVFAAAAKSVFRDQTFRDAAEGVAFFEQRLKELDKRIAERPTIGGRSSAERFAGEREELQQFLDFYQRVASKLGQVGAGAGRGFVIPDLVGPAKPKSLPDIKGPVKDQATEVTDAQRALAAYVEQLERLITKTRDLTQEQQALDFLKGLGAQGEIPQVRDLVLGLARQIDFQKELTESLEDERKLREQIARIQNEQLAAERALDEQIDSFTGRLEAARKAAQTARLEARLQSGEIFTPDELERAVKGIAGIKDEAAKVTDDMSKRFEQFATNVQDALGDTIFRTLSGDFENIGKLWKNLLLRMASEALAADLGKRLFGDLLKASGAGGGGGRDFGLFGSLLKVFGIGFAKGGAFGAGGQRLALADGGVLNGPTPFVFSGGLGVAGEAGPEAVLPLQRGRGGRLGVAAAGGGGGITIINQVSAGVQRGEVITAIQLAMQQVEGRLMQRLARARVI